MSDQSGITLDEDLLFADNMLRLREEQGLSRADLVKLLRDQGWEVHQTTIVRIERREQRVKLREASMIAKALKSTVTHMLQPQFDSEIAERLYRARQRLGQFRAKIHTGTVQWLDAEQDAREALQEASDQGVTPSDREYKGNRRDLPRATARDEFQFVLRELGQPPTETVRRICESRDPDA